MGRAMDHHCTRHSAARVDAVYESTVAMHGGCGAVLCADRVSVVEKDPATGSLS